MTWSAAVGGGGALVASGGYFLGMPESQEALAADGIPDAKTVWNSCLVNCGSRCPLRLQVKDDRVVRVLPDNTGNDEIGTQQIRSCVRGRAIRPRIYSPQRLRKPLRRRPGTARGEGVWDEISWEEALDYVAGELKRILAEYGNEAVYLNYGTGTLGAVIGCSWPPNNSPFARLMNCLGGYLNHYNTYSSAQITTATPYTYGVNQSNNSNDDAANSQLIVWFGYNPLEVRMSGGGETFVTQTTKKNSNVRTIVIDPRYSDTMLSLGDEWVPIRPGTDAALVAGMAHVILSENRQDQAFLDRYVVGFDEHTMPDGIPAGHSYRSYVMGEGPDKTAKSPEWAASITGVPANKIVTLAREIANAKPCLIGQGLGPQRHANGENTVRAIHALDLLQPLREPGVHAGLPDHRDDPPGGRHRVRRRREVRRLPVLRVGVPVLGTPVQRRDRAHDQVRPLRRLPRRGTGPRVRGRLPLQGPRLGPDRGAARKVRHRQCVRAAAGPGDHAPEPRHQAAPRRPALRHGHRPHREPEGDLR